MTDMSAHYTDDGVLPRSAAMENFCHYSWVSVHFLSGRWDVTFLIFALNICVILSMLFGYRSRLSTAVAWFFLNSMHARNILLLHGGDVLLRVLLLWTVFFPLGEVYSVDAVLRDMRKARPAGDVSAPARGSVRAQLPAEQTPTTVNRFFMIGCFLMWAQFTLMYVSSVYWKIGREWTVTHNATYYALRLEYFRTPVGTLFMNLTSQEMLRFMTWLVWYQEKFMMALFIVPLFPGFFRTLGVVSVVQLHLGLCVMLRLNLFFYTPVSGVLGLLPAFFWDTLVRKRLLRTDSRLRVAVYYSLDAPRWVAFMAHALSCCALLRECSVAPASTDALRAAVDNRGSPMLVVMASDGTVASGSAAVILICRASPLLWWYAPLLRRLVAPLRLVLFSLLRPAAVVVARARRWQPAEAPRADPSCRFVDADPRPREPVQPNAVAFVDALRRHRARIVNVALQLAAVYLFVIGMLWCLNNLKVPYTKPSRVSERMAFTFHTDQNWNMFSPNPPDFNWWYVMEGELQNGTNVEVWKDDGMFRWVGSQNYTFDAPKPFYSPIRNHRWIKWYESLNNHNKNEVIRLNYGRFVCRHYNRRNTGDARLQHFRIWFMLSRNKLDGTSSPPTRSTLWEHTCFRRESG